MSDPERGILMFDTTLNADAGRRIQEIGSADVLVGIPSHRNGRTIGEVLTAVAAGVATYLPGERVVLMLADGGSSDNTVRLVEDEPVPGNVEKLLVAYEGPLGKGTAVRAILEASGRLGVKACMVVEARAPGITPEWVPLLLTPILHGDDLVMGCYRRSAHAASLTDNLAYPFLRMFLNADLREPLASEFALAGRLADQLAGADVWETDVCRFGVNAWIATHSLVQGYRISQVDLGFRGEGSGPPGAPLDARVIHVFAILFRILTTHRRLWQGNPAPIHVPFRGERLLGETIASPDCVQALTEALTLGYERYGEAWERLLSGETYLEVERLCAQPRGEPSFSPELWARVALEFGVVYNEGEGDPDRIVEALLPLFYGRTATYIRETEGLSLEERERIVEDIVQSFLGARPAFNDLWGRSFSRLGDVTSYWI